MNIPSKEDKSKEIIKLDILADDDFYKLDLFEEDECDEGEDLGDDDSTESNDDDDDDEEEEEEAEEEEYEDEEEADKGRTDEFEISLTNGYKVAETLDIDDCTTGST